MASMKLLSFGPIPLLNHSAVVGGGGGLKHLYRSLTARAPGRLINCLFIFLGLVRNACLGEMKNVPFCSQAEVEGVKISPRLHKISIEKNCNKYAQTISNAFLFKY